MSLSKETHHPIQTFSSPKIPRLSSWSRHDFGEGRKGLPRAENNPAIAELVAEGAPEARNLFMGQFWEAYLALKQGVMNNE